MLRETFDDDAQLLLVGCSTACAPSTCCTSTTSAPSRRRPWVLEQLYTIVNTRYEDGRALLITTNLVDIAPTGDEHPAAPCGRSTSGRCRASRRCAASRCRCSAPTTGWRRSGSCPRARPSSRRRGAALGPVRRRDVGGGRAALRAPTGSAGAPPRLTPRNARHRDRGRPVGRRGQGQGRRPARRAGRHGDPLPGRQQRRAHDRPRRRQVEVPPDPVRDPLSGQAVRDRQRRRHRPEGADRRARRAAGQAGRPQRPADQRQRAPDHAVPPAARPRRRDEARQAADRHHAARHRPLLRRQGRAPGHPHAGPARREDPQEEDHRGDRAQAPELRPVRQGPGRSTCSR